MKNYETFTIPVETGLTAGDQNFAMRIFEEFLNVPDDIKNSLVFPGLEGRERNTKAGYFRKTTKDKKHVFHYTEALGDYLEQQGKVTSEAKGFIDTAKEFYEIAVSGLSKALSEFHPLLRSVHFTPDGISNHHLRFLSYDPMPNGETIAKDHYDQATLTIAVCEDKPGLKIGTGVEDIDTYLRNPNESVLFPGYGWLNLHKQLGVSTEYLPAWHGARQPHLLNEVSNLARHAIILFANPTYLDTTPSKLQTSTPLMEFDIARLENEGVLGHSEILIS